MQKMKGLVGACLMSLHDQYRSQLEYLKVTARPKKAVYANRLISAGGLVLVPSSTNIGVSVLDADTAEPKIKNATDIALGVLMTHPVNGQNIHFHIAPYTVMPSDKQTGFINPYFFVRVSDDEASANMQVESRDVKYRVGIHDKKSPKLDEVIQIPVLCNFKKISLGDELVVYKAKDQPKAELALKGRPAKRPRCT